MTSKNTEDYYKLNRLDLVGNIVEVQDPKLISSSMLQTMHQFEEIVYNLTKL